MDLSHKSIKSGAENQNKASITMKFFTPLSLSVLVVAASPTSATPTPAPTSTPTYLCFETRAELEAAVDVHLNSLLRPDRDDDDGNVLSYEADYGSISDWCVSTIDDFSELFSANRNANAAYFDEPLNWDVSSATTLDKMFKKASRFTGQGLDTWNTGLVTTMDSTFHAATVFDQDLALWDTSKVTSMEQMFRNAKAFTGGDPSALVGVSKWDVSKVTNFNQMFRAAESFNADLSLWSVNSMVYAYEMFRNANVFNGHGLEAWSFGANVAAMDGMFRGADAFDQPLCNGIGLGWYALGESITMTNMFKNSNCDDTSDPVWDSAVEHYSNMCKSNCQAPTRVRKNLRA